MNTDAIINELAQLLTESVRQMRTLRKAHDYAALPDSPLVNTATSKESDIYGIIAGLGYEIAAAQIAAAEDHMDGMATLLAQGRSSVAPLVLARAAIEASARASYIMHPDVPEKERASCVLGERLNELRQRHRLIVASDPKAKSQSATKDLADTEAAIQSLEDFTQERDLKNPGRPSFTSVVSRTLKLSDEHGSLAAVSTAAYSALAHAVPDMLLTYTVDRNNPEWAPFEIGLGERHTNLLFDSVIAVLLAYSGAIKLQIEAHGWSPRTWATWLDGARTTLLQRHDIGWEGQRPDHRRRRKEKSWWDRLLLHGGHGR